MAKVHPVSMVPASKSGGMATPVGNSPTKKLKLSSVINPTLDAEIVQGSKAELDKMYGDYKMKVGTHPAPDGDPPADQNLGLKQLVSTSALPYVVFSVWTPMVYDLSGNGPLRSTSSMQPRANGRKKRLRSIGCKFLDRGVQDLQHHNVSHGNRRQCAPRGLQRLHQGSFLSSSARMHGASSAGLTAE